MPFKQLFPFLLFFVFLVLSGSGFRAEASDDYSFSWLDPDKKIYVLQNRKYTKAHRAILSGLAGVGLSDTYRFAYQVEPRMAYYFNEDWGIEGFIDFRFHRENNAYKALRQATGTAVSPAIREINSQYGGLLQWAPWYSKINVFNHILYFDWYFAAGAGMMSSDVGPKTKAEASASWKSEQNLVFLLGTGHLFHISESFIFRWDLTGSFYSASQFGGLSGAPTGESLFSHFTMGAGIGLRL